MNKAFLLKAWLAAIPLVLPLPALAQTPYLGPDGTAARPWNVTGTTVPGSAASQPTETTTAIGTSSTNFGVAGTYKSVTIEAQGQAMCVTFGSGTPTAPAGNACAVGMYLAAGQFYSYGPNTTPNSQGKAAAVATGGSLWESVQ